MLFDDTAHPRLRGKFAAKPMTPDQKKAHATLPIKRASITIKGSGGSQPGGDMKRSYSKKGKMNTGSKRSV